jgi:hypothetical protein
MQLFVSCNKNDTLPDYDTSKITIEVLDASSNAALVLLTAEDVKGLGTVTIGICYSKSGEPTILDNHIDEIVDSDTLSEADYNMFYFLLGLTKSQDYYVKGYVKTEADIYYSAKQAFKTKKNTLSITVSDNYIPAGKEYWMVLSEKSTTLLTQKLINGNTYTFSDNIPDLADFHLFKWDPAINKLMVESYADIVPDEFDLSNPYTSIKAGETSVTISDLSNFLEWGISASWWWNTTTISTTNILASYISKNPDNLFISYIPSDGSAPKFKYVNNVTPSSSYTYKMADFTAMSNYANVTLPANAFFYYTLAGFNTDYYTEFTRYHGYSYTTGYPGTFKLYYPAGIRTNYYLYTFYNASDHQSFYNKLGSLPTIYFSAFPAITINNSSKFKTTTSTIAAYSTYEVMDFVGIYSNAGLFIQWDYCKQPQLSNSVQIPEFPAEVKSKINNLTTDDLAFSDVGYFDILNSEVDSYTSYVDLLIKQSERFYDVVKERRYYYQWVNKKSFDSTTKSYNMQEF